MCVIRVYSHTGKNDCRFLIDLLFKTSCQRINLSNSHGIRKFHMNRCNLLVRTVIIDDQIIRTAYAFLFSYKSLNLQNKLFVGTLSKDVVKSLYEHLDTGLDDESCDDHTYVALKRDVEDREYKCGHQYGG